MMILLASCELQPDLPICDYSIQLEYWLSESAQKNELHQYVKAIDEYIFDEYGILFQINRVESRAYNKNFVSEVDLPAGKYSVVSWANVSASSKAVGVEVGKTHINDLMLNLNNPVNTTYNIHEHSERLYQGYRTFSVREHGVSQVRVYMSHAHCILEVIVKWTNNTPPDTENFYMTLRDVKDTYAFTPAYKVFGNTINGFEYAEEQHLITDKERRYYLTVPNVGSRDISHVQQAKMDITRNVSGRFSCYRLSNNTHPLFRLYAGDTPLMREIDLHKYFQNMGIELDTNLKQEFAIIIEIGENDVIRVTPVVISDWNNGGEIGGGTF
ncbi:FimB/Mfa2 family fimbrial subunit [Parabacteroides sp. OttesenSCG-928-G07]|nr:FimB/Mfa2 family fimbrial subunit [Parabacteroides sp. OttesenSCG-928-G07]